MIKIAGVWDLAWNTPIKEIELWMFPLRDFGIESIHIAPKSGIKANSSFNIYEYDDLSEFLSSERSSQRNIIFVDEHGSQFLENFVHPENATYVFGKATLSCLTAYGQQGDLSLKIPTQLNAGLLWPHQAASLVLYDRYLKIG